MSKKEESEEEKVKGWSINDKNRVSYHFIMPMLGKSYRWYKGYVTNAFMGDENFPELDKHIFLLLDNDYKYFEENLKNEMHFPTYFTSYSADKFNTMYVYNVPVEFEIEYSLLTRYNYTYYSKLSPEYKKRIMDLNEVNQNSKIYKMLYKDESLYKEKEEYINEGLPKGRWTKIPRDLEIGDKIDLRTEIYRNWMKLKEYNKYKQI